MNTNKLFFKYVSLNVLGMIGISLYILADTFFIAQALGSNGIASLNLSIPAYGVIHGIGLMLGLGGASRFSILNAQRKIKEARSVYTQSLLFGLIVGIVFSIIGVVGADTIARMLGANNETFANTSIYLRTLLFFSPFFILNNAMQSFVRNDGDPSLAMYGMLLGSFLNIVLDYIFIFPLDMGMFGAALATSIAPISSLAILSMHFRRPTNQLKFVFQGIQLKVMKDICYLGAAGFINEIAAAVVMFSFNTIIFTLEGNLGLAAYGIVANISFVVLSLFTGVAQGAQPLLSDSYGLKDLDKMKHVLTLSIATALSISTLIYVSTFVFRDGIISAFNSDQNLHVKEMAVFGLLIYFIGFFFAGANTILTTYFSATDQPRLALFFSLLRGGFIIIPVVLLLSHLYGMTGVWSSYVVAEAVVIGWIMVKMNPKKRIKQKKVQTK
ncbi:MATE family efflux transporter [Marinilactibacillus sp. XAAS-LB27]|uniref:MATE family efflux transporter n=1 Tax=Marinilactibacillus sp. XAAS-LB27 TaxID=3114538 RepID=UPI002E16E370|nr:MATE family efflux transporter [Marinilactibacillus sp. XAAS-LB27]